MRILHLIKNCQPSNGNVNVAIDLACGQVRKGHRVVYASAGGHYDTLLDAHGVRGAEIRQGQDTTLLRSLAISPLWSVCAGALSRMSFTRT